MKKSVLSLSLIILIFSIWNHLSGENPASENYELRMHSFADGSADVPSVSSSFTMPSSLLGGISGSEMVSSNYSILPGFFLGDLGHFYTPLNLYSEAGLAEIYLSWNTYG